MALETYGLCAAWNGKTVFSDISLRVLPGDFIALTGPNGSGKSTLLGALAGIRQNGLELSLSDGSETSAPHGALGTDTVTDGNPKTGSHELPPKLHSKLYPSLDGCRLARMGRKKAAERIAYLCQTEVPAWNTSVRDCVLTGRFAHTGHGGFYTERDFMVAEKAMEQVQISHLADRGVMELSGGEYQKVRIARALAQEPQYLLLDEPVAPLDFGYQTEILALLQSLTQKSVTISAPQTVPGIVMSIHDLNTASQFASTILLMPTGATGTPEQIIAPAILQKAYGTKFERYPHPQTGAPQVYVPR